MKLNLSFDTIIWGQQTPGWYNPLSRTEGFYFPRTTPACDSPAEVQVSALDNLPPAYYKYQNGSIDDTWVPSSWIPPFQIREIESAIDEIVIQKYDKEDPRYDCLSRAMKSLVLDSIHYKWVGQSSSNVNQS